MLLWYPDKTTLGVTPPFFSNIFYSKSRNFSSKVGRQIANIRYDCHTFSKSNISALLKNVLKTWVKFLLRTKVKTVCPHPIPFVNTRWYPSNPEYRPRRGYFKKWLRCSVWPNSCLHWSHVTITIVMWPYYGSDVNEKCKALFIPYYREPNIIYRAWWLSN